MSEPSSDQHYEARMRVLCEAYRLGISIRSELTHNDLLTALEHVDHSTTAINDGYPAWHPAPYSFPAMVLAFVCIEITGESYAAFTRRLTSQPEIATVLGFDRVPDEFSNVWSRFQGSLFESTASLRQMMNITLKGLSRHQTK